MSTQESQPTMSHRGLRQRPRDTTRRDGGARNTLEIEIRDAACNAVWLRAEPEHGGWSCILGGHASRTGRATTLSSAVLDTVAGTHFVTRKPYAVTLTDIDGECHDGRGSTIGTAVNAAYSALVYAQGAGKARGGG